MASVAVILARGGSKGVPLKNLQEVGGIPLVSRAVQTAFRSGVDEIIVSTDHELIARRAKEDGAFVHMRSAEASSDTASSEEALAECITSLNLAASYTYAMLLQCTAPFMKPEDIRGVQHLLDRGYDSAFAACKFHHFVWRQSPDGAQGVNHAGQQRKLRQQLDDVQYLEAGSVYGMAIDLFLETRERFCGRTGIHVVPADRVFEIDTLEDLAMARSLACNLDMRRSKIQTIYVDVDGFLATTTGGAGYEHAQPIPEHIERVNRLYRDGYTIVIWTARGSCHKSRQVMYEDLTRRQLRQWGVLFHDVLMGKPAYDLLLDDKTLNFVPQLPAKIEVDDETSA